MFYATQYKATAPDFYFAHKLIAPATFSGAMAYAERAKQAAADHAESSDALLHQEQTQHVLARNLELRDEDKFLRQETQDTGEQMAQESSGDVFVLSTKQQAKTPGVQAVDAVKSVDNKRDDKVHQRQGLGLNDLIAGVFSGIGDSITNLRKRMDTITSLYKLASTVNEATGALSKAVPAAKATATAASVAALPIAFGSAAVAFMSRSHAGRQTTTDIIH